MADFKIAETITFSRQIASLRNAKIYEKIKNYIYPQLRNNPFFGPNIKKLKGGYSDVYRYRIGDYRLFYKIADENHVVIIASINNRKEPYR